jgi:hypothetical protein
MFCAGTIAVLDNPVARATPRHADDTAFLGVHPAATV